jgi:T-complex protein 1 subunit delta
MAAFKEKEKEKDIRIANILAAKGVADTVRTSLGPRGMDKMVGKTQTQTIYYTIKPN